MKIQLTVLAGCLLLSASVASGQDAIFSCTGTDGVVALTNVPSGGRCERLGIAAPVMQAVRAVPAASFGAAGANAPYASSARSGVEQQRSDAALAEGNSDRLISYRDKMIKSATSDPKAAVGAGNAAVSRRYLMVDRTTYLSTH